MHRVTNIASIGVGCIVHCRVTSNIVATGLDRPVSVLQHATHTGNVIFLKQRRNIADPAWSLHVGIVIKEYQHIPLRHLCTKITFARKIKARLITGHDPIKTEPVDQGLRLTSVVLVVQHQHNLYAGMCVLSADSGWY